MPKKKLTKTQVKNKLRIANNQIYDLILDKMAPPDSLALVHPLCF